MASHFKRQTPLPKKKLKSTKRFYYLLKGVESQLLVERAIYVRWFGGFSLTNLEILKCAKIQLKFKPSCNKPNFDKFDKTVVSFCDVFEQPWDCGPGGSFRNQDKNGQTDARYLWLQINWLI
jgi:hypothetical protein